jgi:stress response protein YsnF
MTKTVVALFEDYSDAQDAVNELISEGFRREDVHVMAHNAGEAGAGYGGGSRTNDADDNRGFGEKVSDFFSSMFGGDDDDDRDHYSEAIRRGGTMVTVNAEGDMADRATDILERYDPVDIDERATHYREGGYTGFDASAPPYTAEETARERDSHRSRAGEQGEIRVPVVEEDIEVGKRQVRRGGVRVYNRMTETPVEKDVRLREEHVSVDRRPADRPVSEADIDSLQEGTIEVTETAEEPVIAKRARVAEEVVINKEVSERTETVRDSVRRSDVNVEELDADTKTTSKKARNRS